MRYLVFLLGLITISCASEVAPDEDAQSITVHSNAQTKDSVIIEEPIVREVGFPRFFFVKDSLGFELENVKVLADTYSTEKIHFNQLEKDTAYFLILDFLKEIRIASEDDKALYEYNQVKESEIAKYYKRFGILIESSEGEYYCAPDYSYLAKLFKGDLNTELDIYKDFLVVSNRHVLDDGGLMISWMDLASQIIETEDYYHELSNSIYKEDVFSNYTWIINPLLYGTENSFNDDDYNDTIKGLIPEVKSAYDMLILDPIHNSGNLVAAHFENLKNVDFKSRGEKMHYMTDEEIRSFLDEK